MIHINALHAGWAMILICYALMVLGLLSLPETRGRSLAMLDLEYDNRVRPIGTAKRVPG